MKRVIIYTDGASRGNPGHASAGFVIQTDDGVIWSQEGIYLNQATNNVAEYTAVKLALQKLTLDFAKWLPLEVELRADSLLVIQQLCGRYKIKNPALKRIYEAVKGLEPKVGKVSYIHIPRAQNFLADKLANMALDNR